MSAKDLWSPMTDNQVSKRLRYALRQIYNAAQSLERGEEHVVSCAQEIQHICDNALRGWEPRDSFKPIPWPGENP